MINNKTSDERNNKLNGEIDNIFNNETNNETENEVDSMLNCEVYNKAQSYNFSLLGVGYAFQNWKNEVFPSIDHIMSDYLTLHIFSAKRIEIAQCLDFNTTMTNFEIVNSYNE
ncbi:12563_t:CDS:2, partial [Cetraspora pellucida]